MSTPADARRKLIRPLAESALDGYARQHPQLGTFIASSAGLDSCLKRTKHLTGPVIDIGCGQGHTMELLSRIAPDRSVVGVELSGERATAARRRGFHVIVSEAERLPFESGTVPFLICRHVVEHVLDDRRVLSEARRVLRPEGYLYVETPLRLPGAWYLYRNGSGKRVLDPTHVREYRSSDEFLRLLADAGLSSVDFRLGSIRFAVSHIAHRVLRVLGGRGLNAVVLAAPRLMVKIPRYREIQSVSRPRE